MQKLFKLLLASLFTFLTCFPVTYAQNNCSQVPFFGTTGQDILASTLLPQVANLPTFGIRGRLVVNTYLSWSNKNIYMDSDAEIYVQANQIFLLSSVDLKGCTTMWKGITIENGTSGQNATFAYIWHVNIEDAKTAIESRGSPSISILDVEIK